MRHHPREGAAFPSGSSGTVMNIVMFTPADGNPPWPPFAKGGECHASPFIKGGLRGIFTVTDKVHGQAGFTLLELVLATLIASLVMGILASALTFSLRVWEREQSRKGNEAPSMIELLKKQLANADPVNILSAGESRPLFQGDEHSITFTTAYSVRAISKGAPVVVRYFYDPGERLLYYAEIPLDPYHGDAVDGFLNLQPGRESKKGSMFHSVGMTSFSLSYEQAEREEFGSPNTDGVYPDAIVVTWSADEDASPHYALIRPNSFFRRVPEQGGLKGSGSFQ